MRPKHKSTGVSGNKPDHFTTLDGLHPPRDFDPVEETAIKILGQLQKTPWQRFSRLQRTAARLAQGRGQPKGVFRFATHEDCTKWTANLNRTGK